ncbi:MAG: metallophosphoesterase, partial [Firmicutes bacterium]|nr:metallophosphoesterase [Bacillota bacterium]
EDSGEKWKIIVTHHPIYGMHDMFTVSKEIRELWLPILKEGGADLVLCGHQHVYMRTRDMDGMVHIMGVSGAKRSHYYTGINAPAYSESIYSAGPNYQIIKVRDEYIEITSYNEKSSIIDAARIEKDINLPYFRTFW